MELERKWPTPRASDSQGASLVRVQNAIKDDSTFQLREAVKASQIGIRSGQLNPDWVECLMGFPIGWTNIDCDTPELWVGWPALLGEEQYDYESPRVVMKSKNRAKRLKCLGNAVVPQQIYPIFRAIVEVENKGDKYD